MHDDDLLAPLLTLRAGLHPEDEPVFQRIVEYCRQLTDDLRSEIWHLRSDSENRPLVRAVCDRLDRQIDELDKPDPARLAGPSTPLLTDGGPDPTATADLSTVKSEEPIVTARHDSGTDDNSAPTVAGLGTVNGAVAEVQSDATARRELIYSALCEKWHALNADGVADRYLGDLGEPPEDAKTLWTQLHLASWRLPQKTEDEHTPSQFQKWRDQFSRALLDVFGADLTSSPTPELGETVVPAVPDLGVAGVFVWGAPPSAADPADEWQQWVRDRLGHTAGHYRELINAVAHVLTLLAAGDHRRMVWHNRQMGDLGLADDRTLTQYREDLETELRSLGEQPLNSAAALRKLVDIDEFVRIVTHDPLPALDSGWGRNVENLLAWLGPKIGKSGKINSLAGMYKSRRSLTISDANVSASELQSGTPGQVLWTLRIWSSIAEVPALGRVIYVPSTR